MDGQRVLTGVRVVLAIAAIVVGVGITFLTVTVGHCSAFGGRCPSESPPLFDDDVFRLAFVGGFLLVGGVMLLLARPWRRLIVAVPVALAGGVVVGLMARSIAAG